MTRDEAIKELNTFKIGAKSELGKTALDMAIEALEQEPYEDCISREAVENITWEKPNYTDALNVLTEVRDKVRALPSVQPKTGHWEKYKHMIYCSECGASIEAGYLNDMKYCYNCRAIMKSEE